jgi:hypothetical protein
LKTKVCCKRGNGFFWHLSETGEAWADETVGLYYVLVDAMLKTASCRMRLERLAAETICASSVKPLRGDIKREVDGGDSKAIQPVPVSSMPSRFELETEELMHFDAIWDYFAQHLHKGN